MEKEKWKLLNEGTGEIREMKPKKKKSHFGSKFYMTDQHFDLLLAKHKDVNGTDHRILRFITGKMDYENKAVIKQTFIANELVMTQAQVSKGICKLRDKGIITQDLVDGNCCYRVNDQFAKKG